MRILVVGSGGREHALCWVLSNKGHKVWCAPGNPGTAQIAANVPIPAADITSLVKFATANEIAMVIPGPETSLCHGITDAMSRVYIPCFGPTREAARLEYSKSFTKTLCRDNNIPTANWAAFDDVRSAEEHVKKASLPLYIKADGLASGKGAILAETERDAIHIIYDMMERRRLGNAGSVVVIEEPLIGEERSFFALCNDTEAVPFGLAHDYKRLQPDQTSLNTGGMGAHTLADPQVEEFAMDQIILPTLYAMAKGDRPFTGILYAGLMLTEDGPKLIEYNVRLGDPEWQAMAMCFDDDLYWIFDEVSHGTMPILEKPQRMGIAVVMTAPGYPVEPQTGSEIRSIDVPDGTMVFHAGTARTPGGRLIASGGRVLNVCTSADDLPTARERVYAGVAHIDWQEGYYRHDIGVLNYQLEVATADADAIP